MFWRFPMPRFVPRALVDRVDLAGRAVLVGRVALADRVDLVDKADKVDRVVKVDRVLKVDRADKVGLVVKALSKVSSERSSLPTPESQIRIPKGGFNPALLLSVVPAAFGY